MQTSEQIIQVINELCKKFGIALDWTSSNVLPYIQQLGHKMIMYDLYTSIMWLIIGAVLPIGISIWLIKFMNKKKKESIDNLEDNEFYYCDGELNEFGLLMMCLVGILLIISIGFIVNNTQYIIQDLVFPEKTIIEFVRPYLK